MCRHVPPCVFLLCVAVFTFQAAGQLTPPCVLQAFFEHSPWTIISPMTVSTSTNTHSVFYGSYHCCTPSDPGFTGVAAYALRHAHSVQHQPIAFPAPALSPWLTGHPTSTSLHSQAQPSYLAPLSQKIRLHCHLQKI